MAREKVASMIREVDQDGSASVDFEEFLKVLERAKTTQKLAGFANIVHAQKATVMQVKKDNMVHSFAEEECVAFCDFVNNRLAHDPKLSYLLPIREMTDLFSVVADGVVLCKLVNEAVPETIDERAVNFAPRNPFHVTENHNLALEACKSVGMTVVNIGSSDLKEGRPHLVLGLVWQLVKMTLLQNINLKDNPNLLRLLQAGEELEELLKLPPEKLLLRWFNYHLEQAGSSKRINNYGPDLKDSEAYATLLKQIDPNKTANTAILSNQDLHKRAEYVINQGRRMGATGFTIQPADVVKGNDKLNLGFVAALFNACPALEPPDDPLERVLSELQQTPASIIVLLDVRDARRAAAPHRTRARRPPPRRPPRRPARASRPRPAAFRRAAGGTCSPCRRRRLVRRPTWQTRPTAGRCATARSRRRAPPS